MGTKEFVIEFRGRKVTLYNRVGGLGVEFFEDALAFVNTLDLGAYNSLIGSALEIDVDILSVNNEIDFVLKFNCINTVVAIQLEALIDRDSRNTFEYSFVDIYDFV